jgi:hypothetical protein
MNMTNESPVRNEEIVDGGYPLGALIRRSVRSAIYETQFGEDAVPAVIKIREVESLEAENLTQRLWNVAELEHPNLLKIYATGSSMLNGVPIFYVVMERAEESLEAVLAERPLTTSETREMLAPALQALDYLHKKGYAHSRLRPSNVLAMNDQLKLSTDSVIPVSDEGAAEDMRALGVLIVHALGQKIPNAHERVESQDFAEIPQPLADIVRHCLDPDYARRWTVEQVKARLNAPVGVMEENTDADRPKPNAAGLAKIPKWIYAGLAALILTLILAAALRNKTSAPVATPVPAISQQDEQVPPSDPAPRNASQPPIAGPAGRKASGWSVIVGAYRSRELAEKRMREMTKKWPDFQISVIESQGEKTPYLLVLGRNLSEDQAKALRKRAFESRLPGDTYIKRLM